MLPDADRAVTGRLENAVCAACSCLCDDIVLEYRDDGALESVARACEIGERWLRAPRRLAPAATVRGDPIDLDVAIERAARMLIDARAPLVEVASSTTLEASRAAWLLADRIGAAVAAGSDGASRTEAGFDDRSGLDVPEAGATLGEIRAHADLVVFWEADPLRTHPRHLERYSFDPMLRSGRARRLVVIDCASRLAANLTAARAAETVLLATVPLATVPLATVPLATAGPDADGDDRACRAAALELCSHVRMRLLDDARAADGDARAADGDARAADDDARAADGDARAADDDAGRLAGAIRAARHAHFFLGLHAADDSLLRDGLHDLAARLRTRTRVTVSALGDATHLRAARETAVWLGVAARPAIAPSGADAILVIGSPSRSAHAAASADVVATTIRIAEAADAGADAGVAFVVPGLDPRLDATIVRSDGVHLTLCGRSRGRAGGPRGVSDPTARILDAIAARVEASS